MYLKVLLGVLALVACAYGMSPSPEPSSCCACVRPTASREPKVEPSTEPKKEPKGEPEKEPKSEGEPPEAWYGMLGGLLGVFVIATVVLAYLLVKTKKQLKEEKGYPSGYNSKVAVQDLPPQYTKS